MMQKIYYVKMKNKNHIVVFGEEEAQTLCRNIDLEIYNYEEVNNINEIPNLCKNCYRKWKKIKCDECDCFSYFWIDDKKLCTDHYYLYDEKREKEEKLCQ